ERGESWAKWSASTVSKLQDFNRRLVEQNPCDEQALWCQIALAQKNSSGYLSSDAWRQLHRCGKLDVRWPVESAYYIAASLGEYASWRSCLSRDLALFLREQDLCAAAEPVLIALPGEVEPPMPELVSPILPADWAARVLHGMQDPSLWDGIRQMDALSDGFRSYAADLLQRTGVPDRELAFEAAQVGFSAARPGQPWTREQQAACAGYLEREIHALAAWPAEPEEGRLTLLFGALGYGM